MADKMQNESGDSSNMKETEKLLTNKENLAQKIWNNCAMRSVGMGVLGGSLGFLMDNRQNERTFKQAFKYEFRRGWSPAKKVAIACSIFWATECVVEKVRGKHDTTAAAVAGCVAGAAVSAKGGPKVACVNCAYFAAASATIVRITEGHKPTTQ